MESSILIGSLIQENTILGVVIIVLGVLFLFFGAWIYYSAIRIFGSLTGALIGIIICYHVIQNSTEHAEGVMLFLIYFLSALFGALIGGSLAIIFHYIVFFAGGAIVSLVIYKMIAQGLIMPDTFQNLTFEQFIQLVVPEKPGIETVIMIVGGIIYMASAHLIIVLTMSVLGAFMIAYALDIYILFPILSIVGAFLQYLMTHKKRRTVVIRRKIIS